MTATATDQRQGAGQGAGRGARNGALAGWLASLKATLDKPLVSYYLLVGAAGLLLTIGMMMVLSSSSVYSFREYDNSYAVFLKQLTWVMIAIPCAWIASRLPHKAIRALAWPALIGSMILLGLTQTSLGVEVNGNQNWLALGPFVVQPAEIAKLAVILWCADVYATKEKLLGDWKHTLIPVVPVMGVVIGLVVVGHDLGTALVLMGIVLGMLWVVGAPGKLFVGSLLTVGSAAFFLAATDPERRERLTTFADPFQDFGNSGWQAAHGIFAMSRGGIFGQGIGASQQKWGSLPEAHTDFVFAVLGEELGLVGTLLVLGLFLTMAYAGIRTAMRAQDAFVRFMAAGITVWLTVQMIINVGMVLALLPVIGIPLPMLSYGGSSLLPTLVAVGLLLSFARSEPGARAALQARRRRRPAGVTAVGWVRRNR
ncbi:MAG TPA: putative lipid II flippase FtsW [Nocardioidaceae bacterium]|nr:putative lipid II flippase FtsW [Nocardioidaceae bacterium]